MSMHCQDTIPQCCRGSQLFYISKYILQYGSSNAIEYLEYTCSYIGLVPPNLLTSCLDSAHAMHQCSSDLLLFSKIWYILSSCTMKFNKWCLLSPLAFAFVYIWALKCFFYALTPKANAICLQSIVGVVLRFCTVIPLLLDQSLYQNAIFSLHHHGYHFPTNKVCQYAHQWQNLLPKYCIPRKKILVTVWKTNCLYFQELIQLFWCLEMDNLRFRFFIMAAPMYLLWDFTTTFQKQKELQKAVH